MDKDEAGEKLAAAMESAIKRFETIQETNPEISLDADLNYYREALGWYRRIPSLKRRQELWNTRANHHAHSDVVEAAWALIHACEQMAEDTAPMFAEMQLARGRGPYTGKQIGEELGALKAALQARPTDTALVGVIERLHCNLAAAPHDADKCFVTLDDHRAIITALRSNHDYVVEKCAMTHDEAIDAICGCAQTVTVLSYQEAIEGYLKLRGWQQ